MAEMVMRIIYTAGLPGACDKAVHVIFCNFHDLDRNTYVIEYLSIGES